MLTTFPQCNLSLEFPVLFSQNLIRYHWVNVSRNSKTMHCGILIDMPYRLAHMVCIPFVNTRWLWEVPNKPRRSGPKNSLHSENPEMGLSLSEILLLYIHHISKYDTTLYTNESSSPAPISMISTTGWWLIIKVAWFTRSENSCFIKKSLYHIIPLKSCCIG